MFVFVLQFNFRASLLWMLSSLFKKQFLDNFFTSLFYFNLTLFLFITEFLRRVVIGIPFQFDSLRYTIWIENLYKFLSPTVKIHKYLKRKTSLKSFKFMLILLSNFLVKRRCLKMVSLKV